MNRFWKAVVRPVIEAIEPRVVVEVGAERGAHTRLLLEHLADAEAVVHAIDPVPRFDVDEWGHRYGGRLVLHREKSLNALPRIGCVDLVLIDGDHNWYTTYHELQLISRRAAADGRAFPLVMLHDVDWPYGRRDLYYDPEAVPPAYRQPYERLGMRPGSGELVERGGLNPHLHNSIYEHPLKNGVRTAVEDFLEEEGAVIVEVDVPGLNGLAILASWEAATANGALAELLARFRSAEFLTQRCEEIEQARLLLQIAVSESTKALAAGEERERELSNDLSGYEQQLGAKDEELRRGAEREAAAKGEGERLESQVERVRKELEAMRDEAAHRRQALEAARAEDVEVRQRLESELERLRKEVEAASGERTHVQGELLQPLEAARDEAGQHQRALEAARAEDAKARQQAAAGVNELQTRAAGREAAAEEERRRLESAVERLGSELEAANEERARLEAEALERHSAFEAAPATRPPVEAVGGPDDPPDARELAVREELSRRHAATAGNDGDWGGGQAASFLLPTDWRRVLTPAAPASSPGEVTADVVVCVHNALEDVKRCLWSLLAKTDHPFHLVLVNDGSDDATSDYLTRFADVHPVVTLIHNQQPPHGYTVAANLGLRSSTGGYVILLNSDTIVTQGWLDRLISCGESDERIGILGPLSNAASHQSVPLLRDQGAWATNPLPGWLTPDGMGSVVAHSSQHAVPRLPFINGFCYAIKRRVIDEVGYFDEERFAAGYCEENDLSHRAREAGFELAVADDAYVYHAKSKSYGADGRAAVAKEHYATFLEKHGEEKISSLVRGMEADQSLSGLRETIAATTSDSSSFRERFRSTYPSPLSVRFVLPGMSKGSGGGVHSIYQETLGMRSLGIDARVALGEHSWQRAAEVYPDADEVFLRFSGTDDLLEKTRASDIIVATHFKSVPMVQAIAKQRDDFLPAYYIQDYEPFFSEHSSESADEALLSYGAIPNQLLFAKTHWLCNLLGQIHGVPVAKVEPSIDHDVYHPGDRSRIPSRDPVRIVGMVRPRTARRQPMGTLRLLDRLKQEFGERVQVFSFGCPPADLTALERETPYRVPHQGLLTRAQVAALLRNSDVFLDFSVYQAFGRTGLEAMACGCTSILPRHGGAHEFAVDGHNGLLVDTADEEGTYERLVELIEDAERIRELQANALLTAQSYSVLRAALSEYVLFEHEHAQRVNPSRAAISSGPGSAAGGNGRPRPFPATAG